MHWGETPNNGMQRTALRAAADAERSADLSSVHSAAEDKVSE